MAFDNTNENATTCSVADARLSPFMEKKTMTAAFLKEITLGLNEDSLRERKQRVKSTTAVQQTMKAYIVAAKQPDTLTPEKKYNSFSGTTRGNLLAFINMQPYDAMWQATLAQKAKIYGPRRIVPTEVEEGQVKRFDETMETVFFHSLPALMWQDVLRSFSAKGVVDLACGSGEVCKAAMLLRIPILAFTLSEHHSNMLQDHLVEWMLGCMRDPANTFFNQKYKEWVKPAPAPPQAGKPQPQVVKPQEKVQEDAKKDAQKKEKKTRKKSRSRSRHRRKKSSSSDSDS